MSVKHGRRTGPKDMRWEIGIGGTKMTISVIGLTGPVVCRTINCGRSIVRLMGMRLIRECSV